MLRETANLTVLNAEIIDGHHLQKRLGEKEAQRLLRSFIKDLSSIIWSSNGESIGTSGSRLTGTFFSADDAVIAATTMHQFAFAHPSIKLDGYHSMGLQIRIGTGVVVRNGKKITGEPVNFAQNTEPTAHPFKTLISENTCDYLSSKYAGQTRFLGQWRLNGDSEWVNIYEYIADPEDTIINRNNSLNCDPPIALDLVLGSTILTVDKHNPVCTIGRQVNNDIILKFPRVSRWHAKIEKRKDKFYIRDTSANGTYIKVGKFDIICLRHDELQLIGKGVIFPGREATPSSQGAIHFSMRQP